MRGREELIEQGAAAELTGWDFGWLDGRATEQRPPWGYARRVAGRLASVSSALDIDTGGGEVIAEIARLPARMVVTEGWPPNVTAARRALEPRGVEVVAVDPDGPLPFPDASFELVTSRHPVRPDFDEVARLLTDDGRYLAQHVGPASAFELIEYFLGPQPAQRHTRDPATEAADAQRAGLEIVECATARCRMEFHDIGAVVYILRKCPWWVPNFTVERHRDTLNSLDARIRRDGPFVAHSTRTLFDARRRARQRPGRAAPAHKPSR